MIDRIFGKLAEVINHHPRRVAVVIGIVFIVALYGMTLITMETGNDTYLNKDSPEGILNKHYTDTFSSNALILIVETSDPLSPQVLSYIDGLEQNINQQENVVGSASIADLLKSANGGILPQSKGEIDRIVARIPPEVKATAVPSNVLTLVQVTLSQGLSEDAKSATLKNVESLIANNGPPPGVKISVSGSAAFSEQMKTEMGSSMAVLIGSAMVLMVIVLGILFSYASHRFLPVLFVGIGLTTAMGFMGLAGIQLNMAVLGAFPVMIGLGIDYGIQFHARLDEEARKGSLDKAVTGNDNPYRSCRHVRNACHLYGIYRDVYLDSSHDPLIRACGDDRCHELLRHFAYRYTDDCTSPQLHAQTTKTRGLLCGRRRSVRLHSLSNARGS